MGAGSDAIPRAITDLAEIFGLVVIAEGVERAEQTERLVELGCRFGQGNALAPALPPVAADAAIFGAGLLAGEPLTPEGQAPKGQTTQRRSR
jgi:EAL domain-containing protein (putative c-di-GMP-specific phosphodiesterase class I)